MATEMVPRRRQRRAEDEEHASHEDEEPESDEENAPRFPVLSKRSTVEFIQPLSAAALVGVTTINVLSSTGHDPTAPGATHKDLRTFLVSMPYTMFVVGVMGLGLAMGAKRRPYLLGFASGFLLLELMYIVLIGGLVTIARSDVSGKIVWPVTVTILIAVVVIWSLMCSYPKFLRFCGCCADRRVTSKKRCEVCEAWTVGRKALVAATEGQNMCPSCGAAADLESQTHAQTAMSRGGSGTASTKPEGKP